MKQAQIAKVLGQELGTTNIDEINKILRQKNTPKTKYRMSGKSLGHLGVTGLIKMITADGVKVIGGTRTILVRFEEIEGFEKAKPRSERPVYTTPKDPSKAALAKLLADDEDDDEGDDDDLGELVLLPPKKRRKRPAAPVGKSGSKFIPKEKK